MPPSGIFRIREARARQSKPGKLNREKSPPLRTRLLKITIKCSGKVTALVVVLMLHHV